MNENLTSIIEAIVTPIINGGDDYLSQPPENFSQAAGVFALCAINEWMNGSTSSSSAAIDKMIQTLQKKDDPIFKSLGVMERQMLWTMINTLTKEKARRAQGK